MSAPRRKRPAKKPALPAVASKSGVLAADIRQMIEVARQQVTQAVNAGLTTLYWQIGARIRQDILKNERAEYGAEIVATLGRQLETEFGRGFGEKNLRRMVQFAETFPDAEIVATLWRQLGWAHFKSLIPMNDSLKRDFYAEMCRIEGWSTRTLQQKIDGMLYDRTALSTKPDRLIRQELDKLRSEDALMPDLVLQDPNLLDFFGLKDTHSESPPRSAPVERRTRGRVSTVSQIEKKTQARAVKLFREQLGYDYLGDWTECREELAHHTAIAAVLSDIDAELAALEQRLAKTRTLQQGMMQELLTGRTRLI